MIKATVLITLDTESDVLSKSGARPAEVYKHIGWAEKSDNLVDQK